MMHTFEADGISLAFGRRKILSDVYFRCETGKITALLGGNGQGKTCLMNVVYGTLPAESKSVRFDQRSVPAAFKDPGQLTYLPQFQFVSSAFSLKRFFADFGLRYDVFQEIFPAFKTKYHAKMKQLSGGQRRLVEVYAIVKTPSRFSMLDEPFSHLMPLHIELIKALIQKEKAHKGFLVTDHLFRHVTDLSDKFYVLEGGQPMLRKVWQISDDSVIAERSHCMLEAVFL